MKSAKNKLEKETAKAMDSATGSQSKEGKPSPPVKGAETTYGKDVQPNQGIPHVRKQGEDSERVQEKNKKDEATRGGSISPPDERKAPGEDPNVNAEVENKEDTVSREENGL